MYFELPRLSLRYSKIKIQTVLDVGDVCVRVKLSPASCHTAFVLSALFWWRSNVWL